MTGGGPQLLLHQMQQMLVLVEGAVSAQCDASDLGC